MSLAGTLPDIFECPHCGETIEVSAESCRFCGTAVDRPLALHRAMILAKVNSACSDATYMRSSALAVPVFFVLRFVPLLGFAAGLGFTILCFVIPVWAVIWWTRYSDLESEDADYIKSRKAVRVAGITVGVVLVLLVILPLLFALVYGFMKALHR